MANKRVSGQGEADKINENEGDLDTKTFTLEERRRDVATPVEEETHYHHVKL